jgi:DMSO/TMAO reductase YedYZ molybdopterin-dependent catalytic subunit
MTSRVGPSRWLGAICGLLAAAIALGIAQLLAGIAAPNSSPADAVGSVVINHTPLSVKLWATSTFGTSDKTVLLTGVFVVVFLYAMVVGVLAARRLAYGFAGLTLFAIIGIAAAVTTHGASPGYALPTLFGALVGAFALYRLIEAAQAMTEAREAREARRPAARGGRVTGALPPLVFGPADAADAADAADDGDDKADAGAEAEPDDELRAPDLPLGWHRSGEAGPAPASPPTSAGTDAGAGRPPIQPTPSRPSPLQPTGDRPAWATGSGQAGRRSFLLTAGVTVAAAAIGEVGGRNLGERKNVSAAQAAIRFPKAAVPAPPLPKGVNLPVPGISPFITPNGQFYRVDTAIIVPQVDPTSWTLRIHGMVAREVVVTFDQLLRRPLIEDYITLCCVSNPVDGGYVGNAKWLGASLASLIRSAGPMRGAEQLLCTSVDGFTSGVPLVTVLDGRDSLVAVAMNGTVLPTEHGFPARLVVPGLYGYVSACKWVVDIEVTTWAAAQAYWVPLGWSQQAPIKTESRIDVPASGQQVKAGKTAVAGVAWAQHKGIEAVEVRVDNGPWHEATLAAVPDLDTWRQWVWEWDATGVGPHTIEARATDKTGYTQTSVQEPEAPNGASGYPTSQINVYQ